MIEVRRKMSNKFNEEKTEKLGNIIFIITKAIKVFSKAVAGAIIMQVIFTLVPDFSQRFPIIYGVYDGFLQFAEFLFKYACKFIWEGNVDGIGIEWQQLGQELINWTQKFL